MPHFTKESDPKLNFEKVDPHALEMLEAAREAAGVPFRITSSYRTPEHTLEVGGLNGDAHTEDPCTSFDIAWADTLQLARIIDGLHIAGFERIGVNPFNFHVHADDSPKLPRPRFWVETPTSLMIKALETRGYVVTKKNG